MNEICLRQNFAAAGVGAYARAAGGTLVAQVKGAASAEIQGSNFPGEEGSWVTLGTAQGEGFEPFTFTTAFAYLRVSVDAACEVIVSAAQGWAGLGGGGAGGTDREVVVTTYVVKTAFTGAAVGNTITCTQVLDVSDDTPSTVATLWRNHTTAADLAGAPSAANLTLVGRRCCQQPAPHRPGGRHPRAGLRQRRAAHAGHPGLWHRLRPVHPRIRPLGAH